MFMKWILVLGVVAGLGAQAAPPVPEFKEGLWRQDGKHIRVTLTDDAVIIRSGTMTTIPYLSIKSITYDRRRSGTGWNPLYGIGSNSVDHWLTIQHTDTTTGGYYTFRMSEIVLNRLFGNLEARSGHKIERTGG
jgi:hypothetical protein